MFQRFFVAVAVLLMGASAAEAAPPIEAYGKLPSAEAFELSPSGNRLAFVSDSPDGRAVFVMEDNKLIGRVRIVDKDDKGQKIEAKIRHIDWADEDHVLVWTSKTYNLGMDYGFEHEIGQVLVVNLKAKDSFYVFEKDTMILNGVFEGFGYVRKDGHVYGLFESQALDQFRAPQGFGVVYKVDLDSQRSGQVAVDAENPREWLFAPDGDILANTQYDKITGDWRLWGGAKHDVLLAQSKSPFESDGIEGQGRTPGTILYLTHDADDGAAFFEATANGAGQPTPMFKDLDQVSPMFDRESGLLIGATFVGETPDAMFFDAHQEAVWKGVKKAFPNLNVTLVSHNTDFNKLFVYTDGDDDSGTDWIVDIKTGHADPFGSAYPDVKSADVGPRKYVQYRAADGTEIEGVLTLPPGSTGKNLPVIVLPHGGPRAHDDLAFDWWAEAFASRGYAVFQPNFRGSTGYGAEFVQAGYGEWGKKMQTDISDGLADLAKKGVVDPKRACIVGASYGGYAALAGVTVQTGLYRCAVAVAGVSDLRAMLIDEADKNNSRSPELRYWKTAMGAKSTTDGALREISPANLASKADAPILLIHGKDDTTVPIEQSRIMERALKGAGKPVEFVQLDGEDHYLSRTPTRVAMLQATIAFVEKYNPSK